MHAPKRPPEPASWALRPTDRLYFRFPRRITTSVEHPPEGNPVFRLNYGDKEIDFDDPRDFDFARQLSEHHRFRAGSSQAWSAQSYTWSHVQGYLQALLEEGVLELHEADRRSGCPAPAEFGVSEDDRQESPRSDAGPPEPLTCSARPGACEDVFLRLVGAPHSVRFVETLLPVNHLARPALDVDGRQLGETNVDPALNLGLPTEYAQCRFSGSRYMHSAPMNVTAFRKVMRDWPEIVATVATLRASFLERLGCPPGQRLSVGEAGIFAEVALSWPALLLLRGRGAVPNGKVPAVLSGMFMLLDGIRIASEHFLTHESPRVDFGSVVEVSDFCRWVDTEQLLISSHGRGVCAGPPKRIEELAKLIFEPGTPASPDAPQHELLFQYAGAAIELADSMRAYVHRSSDIASSLLASVRTDSTAVSAFEAQLLRTVGPQSARDTDIRGAEERLALCRRLRGGSEERPAASAPARGLSDREALESAVRRSAPSWEKIRAGVRDKILSAVLGLWGLRDVATVQARSLQSWINNLLSRSSPGVVVDESIVSSIWRLRGLEDPLAPFIRILAPSNIAAQP